MKKYFLLLISILSITSVSNAQTKTAYCDLYVRGGAQHQRTTLMYNNTPLKIGKANTAEMLNALSALGWELKGNDISGSMIEVKRFYGWPITRHKYHFILCKTYSDNENPYQGLSKLVKTKAGNSKTNIKVSKKEQERKNKPSSSSSNNEERKYPEWGTR